MLNERRAHKDAYATNFKRIRQFPALHTPGYGLKRTENVIVLQDSAPLPHQNDQSSSPVQKKRISRSDNAHKERLKSKRRETELIHGPDTRKSSMNEFRATVLCKPNHTTLKSTVSNEGRLFMIGDSTKSVLKSRNSENERKPFRPCNPSEAKDSIRRPTVLLDRMPEPKEEIDTSRPKWKFSSASKAKESIAVNYYLNSPDESSIIADRMHTKELIQHNISDLRKQSQQRFLQYDQIR